MKDITVEKCWLCGKKACFRIQDSAVLLREAKCSECGSSLRNSDVAKCIGEALLNNPQPLKEELFRLAGFRILNTCSSGYIHEVLKVLPGYYASEYFDDVPNGEKKNNVLCADLMNLPFSDDYFDLIISEDVFEHIIDYKKAFLEVRRVLKPGGFHIFTVPVHEYGTTKTRIGKEKVYHGDPIREAGALVITDFGDDLDKILSLEMNFPTEKKNCHRFYSTDEISNVDLCYEEYLRKLDNMDEFFKYNSIVFVSRKQFIYDDATKDIYREKSLPNDELKNIYLESNAIEEFDADKCIKTLEGCYQIEEGEPCKFVWASQQVSFILKKNQNSENLRIKGFFNYNIFEGKANSCFTFRVYAGEEKKLVTSMSFSDNTPIDIRISLKDDRFLHTYIPFFIETSDSFCPKDNDSGEDERRLSWILNSIKQE